VRGGELPTITYRRAWIKAGRTALSAAEQASPLARRPYDLRHACLSTWLNGGVYPTQVAEWAGHSVDVLLRIYAKCVVGQDELAKPDPRSAAPGLRCCSRPADHSAPSATGPRRSQILARICRSEPHAATLDRTEPHCPAGPKVSGAATFSQAGGAL
jgi:hypothetical protein